MSSTLNILGPRCKWMSNYISLYLKRKVVRIAFHYEWQENFTSVT
jgi:hypothetical protein